MSLAFLALSGLSATPLAAVEWSGAGDNDLWSNPLNWVGGVPPQMDAVVFPAAAALAGPNPTNDIGPYTFNSIRIVGAYTITSTHTITTPTINATATATIDAPLVVPTGQTLTIIQETGLQTLTLSKAISGTGPVTIGGAGVVEFTGSAANTYTGLTLVQTTTTAPLEFGYLRLARTAESIPANLTIIAGANVIIDAGSSQINSGSLVTVNGTLNMSLASGTDIGNDNETIGALVGIGKVILDTRQLGCYLAPATAPDYSGVLEGTVASSFRKHGSFTQILSGNSAGFLGTTVVDGSALTILGQQVSSDVTASEGTVLLARSASVGSVTMSGTSNLSVGNHPAVVNQATIKNLSLASTTRMDVFTGSTAGNSQLAVVGSVALNGASLSVNTETATPETIIVIILNDGTDAVSGTFANLPQDALLTSMGPTPVTFQIKYNAGLGNNDVQLEVVAAGPNPKPGITSASTASGTVGLPFTSYTITATNGPFSSRQASNLPDGLTVDTATGVISGTPTTAGTKSVLVSATNGAGTGSGTVTMTIAAVGGSTPPPGSSGGGSSSGCGAGGAAAVLGLLFMLSMTLVGGRRRQS